MCQEMFFFYNFAEGNQRHANAWNMLLTGAV